MPKTKEQKKKIVGNLVDKLKGFKGLVFTNFKGLNVKEINELRGLCRKENVEYVVTKKTLLKLALEKAGFKGIDLKTIEGELSMAISVDDEVAAARVLDKFSRDHKVLEIKGGILEGQFIDFERVKGLANLPSKGELLAMMVGSIQAPVSALLNVFQGNIRNLVYVLEGIKGSRE